jgi:DNA-binding protein YbaB
MNENLVEDLKDKMANQLEQLKQREYTGDAGAGMVRVTVTADLRIIKVEIDHTMFAKTMPEMVDDLDFLADLFKAAASQAIDKSNKDVMQSGLIGY